MKSLIAQQKFITVADHRKAINTFYSEMKIYAETKGKEHAESGNKPHSADEFQILIGNKITNEYQTLIFVNHQVYSPISNMVGAEEHKKEADKKTEKLKAERSDMQVEKNQLKEKIKMFLPNKVLKNIRTWIMGVLVVVGIVEGVYGFAALQSKGLDFASAFCTGIALAAIVSVGTHILAGVIKRTVKRMVKILKWAGSLIVPALLFYWVATWRVEGYTIESDYSNLLPGLGTSKAPLNVWGFAGISFIIYLAGLCISYYFAKTIEEKETEATYNKLTGQLHDMLQHEQVINNAIDAIEKEKEQVTLSARKNYEEAVATENQLISMASTTLESYKDKNGMYRTDKIVPAFFKDQYPFNLKRFFDTLKTNNHDTN